MDRCQTKRDTLVLQVEGFCVRLVPLPCKNTSTRKLQKSNTPDCLTGNRRGKNKDFGLSDILTVGTWNVRGLSTKESELVRLLKKRSVNITVVTETKKKLRKTKDIEAFIMIYSRVQVIKRASCGVAILVDNKWKNKIVNYTYVNERIIVLRIRIERGYLCIFGVYAPEEGRKEKMNFL